MGETILDYIEQIAHLKRCMSERDAEIAAIKAELTECQVKRDMWEHYYEEEAKGASYMEADIKELRLQVAELQAMHNAVPVDAISRYYYGTIRIEGIYTDGEYNYDSSILEQWIGDMA